jgi:hypothetical protein
MSKNSSCMGGPRVRETRKYTDAELSGHPWNMGKKDDLAPIDGRGAVVDPMETLGISAGRTEALHSRG